MRPIKFKVILSDEQTKELNQYIRSGYHTARNITHARILLLSSSNKTDDEISIALNINKTTVARIRKRFYESGLEVALKGFTSKGKPPKLDTKAEAALMAIACSKTPDGRATWTMQLIADKMVELNIIDSISDETVRRYLKKTKLSHGRKNNGV